MRTQSNSGWRKLPERLHLSSGEVFDATRNDLYRAMKDTTLALNMPKASIAVLRSLISFFKEPLNGRMLVWPSNESLELATGYSERSIRAAIRDLIGWGLILPKESANGKRFAIRAAGGIVDAFGFDLTPLMERREEMAALAIARLDERALWRRQHDAVTIARRQVEAIIEALEGYYPEIDREALETRFSELTLHTPKRTKDRSPGAALSEWESLKAFAESVYNAASAGNSCRLIENNKNRPDQSCQNGHEYEEKAPGLPELRAACPDAFEMAGAVRTERDLVNGAEWLRGSAGMSRDGWEEAVRTIGSLPAAVLFFILLQDYDDDQNRGKATIRNFGGYYRAKMRSVATGELTIAAELGRVKRRRQH